MKMKIKKKIPIPGLNFKAPRHHKNFSQNDLSSVLEVIIKTNKVPKSSTHTPNKRKDTVKSKQNDPYDSFEDLSKGLVLIVSGENSIPQTNVKGYDTTKDIEQKFDNSKK